MASPRPRPWLRVPHCPVSAYPAAACPMPTRVLRFAAAMDGRPIRCRRARRTDAEAVFALLDHGAAPARPRDRAGRHRFRQLVADLGADCYVALIDETVVGLVHVTYARHLLDGQRATVELLLGPPTDRGGEV